ncbi:MAG: DUF3098 domain-containing protein [Paraprevotella sp.]|nr:DUF3098 domain-containing protein [Paraprevotella sp.]
MNKRDFAFDKMNFILLAIGMVVVIIGFILMSGEGSTITEFNPDIFSVRRIKVAPVVCLAGFLFIIYGIMHKPCDQKAETSTSDIQDKGEE